MLIKIKTVEDAVNIAKQELKDRFGYDDKELARLSQETLLDYVPEEYFGKEHEALGPLQSDGINYYYVGIALWAIDEKFVETVTK